MISRFRTPAEIKAVLARAAAGAVDVLFVGTGRQIAHLPEPFRAALDSAGVGAEVMDSPAAARTYNVLLAEARRVAAALLPVD